MPIFKKKDGGSTAGNVWARPGMAVTFRAELMPGRTQEERTFRIIKVRSNGRVVLDGFDGEHREAAFEPLKFNRTDGDDR
jgi:hypothetical protein